MRGTGVGASLILCWAALPKATQRTRRLNATAPRPQAQPAPALRPRPPRNPRRAADPTHHGAVKLVAGRHGRQVDGHLALGAASLGRRRRRGLRRLRLGRSRPDVGAAALERRMLPAARASGSARKFLRPSQLGRRRVCASAAACARRVLGHSRGESTVMRLPSSTANALSNPPSSPRRRTCWRMGAGAPACRQRSPWPVQNSDAGVRSAHAAARVSRMRASRLSQKQVRPLLANAPSPQCRASRQRQQTATHLAAGQGLAGLKHHGVSREQGRDPWGGLLGKGDAKAMRWPYRPSWYEAPHQAEFGVLVLRRLPRSTASPSLSRLLTYRAGGRHRFEPGAGTAGAAAAAAPALRGVGVSAMVLLGGTEARSSRGLTGAKSSRACRRSFLLLAVRSCRDIPTQTKDVDDDDDDRDRKDSCE
eukprot:362057-Chlamydomonas_euryale.AAC.6